MFSAINNGASVEVDRVFTLFQQISQIRDDMTHDYIDIPNRTIYNLKLLKFSIDHMMNIYSEIMKTLDQIYKASRQGEPKTSLNPNYR